MPEYYVSTHAEPGAKKARVLVIKADYYKQAGSGDYDFYNKSESQNSSLDNLVASVNNRAVFAITETEDAYQADFYGDLGTDDEDESDDVCIDCRNRELLESDSFFDKVLDIVDAYHQPDEVEDPDAEQIQGAVQSVDSSYPVQHWKNDVTDDERWGITTGRGFIHFMRRQDAEANRQYVIDHVDDISWDYLNLTGYTKVED